MDRKIEYFTVREVLESGLKGMDAFFSEQNKYKYKTIFHNNKNSENIEDIKMFSGIWFKDKFYELKIIMKRDRIEFDDKFEVSGDKGIIYEDFYNFINTFYSIVKFTKTNNKLYIQESEHDYEVSFILKRGVS